MAEGQATEVQCPHCGEPLDDIGDNILVCDCGHEQPADEAK